MYMSVMKIVSLMLSSFSLGFSTCSLIINLMNRHYDKKKNAELEKLLVKRDRETDLPE
jgi:hypothetical protein